MFFIHISLFFIIFLLFLQGIDIFQVFYKFREIVSICLRSNQSKKFIV